MVSGRWRGSLGSSDVSAVGVTGSSSLHGRGSCSLSPPVDPLWHGWRLVWLRRLRGRLGVRHAERRPVR